MACLVLAGTAFSQVEVVTNRNDVARTGANLKEKILNTSNVNAGNFGKLFTRAVDGNIYAQPLYLSQVAVPGRSTRNLVFVATEHNSVYAFDADIAADAAPLWKVNLGPTVPSNDVCQGLPSCVYTDLSPEIGITSTPVIDTGTGTLYVVAKTKSSNHYQFVLHALDVASGAEKFGGPVEITASVKGSGAGSSGGTVSFDSLHQNNRPGLLLLNGVVYIAFGAVGDIPPFHGWVLGYDATTLQQVAVFNSSPNGEAAGIWAGGQGLASEGSSIFLATGNGTFDADSGGPDLGSSFLRLDASHGLSLADFFTPHNQGYLTSADLDVGSGGVVLLPGMNLALGVGKDGMLRLVDPDQLGKYNATFDNDVQQFQTAAIFMGAPVFWNGPAAPAVYLWGGGDYLKQYTLAGGQLATPPRSRSTMTTPAGDSNSVPLSLSANGNTPGSGIVWAAAPYSETAPVAGILRAFDAADVSHELWNSEQDQQRDQLGNFVKFCPPTVANGKLYAPTSSGQLVVYGLTSGDFSIKAEPNIITQTGESASSTVKIIPQANGLTSPVSLACSDLPPGVSCRFTPPSLPSGADPMQSTLTVTTTSAVAKSGGGRLKFLLAGWLWLGCLCGAAAPLSAKRPSRLLGLMALGLACAGLLLAPACGGGASSVPAPVVSVPLTGKFSVVAVSGGIVHKSTLTLSH